MKYSVAALTDIGKARKSNQDAVCVKIAKMGDETIVMALVCDGMGGLSEGEVASASVASALNDWFEQELPALLQTRQMSRITQAGNELIHRISYRMKEYGANRGLVLGTTISCLVLAIGEFGLIHVGDSRIYQINRQIHCLTTDHSVVARDLAKGLITPEEAKVSPKRNKLTQCVGASRRLEPEIKYGTVTEGDIFLLCSDGLWHKISEEEMLGILSDRMMKTEEDMERKCKTVTNLVLQRGEKDNISIVLVRAEQGE